MKKLIAIIGLIALTVTANARTVKDFFVNSAATKAIPLLSNNTRLDMVDYFEGGFKRTSINDMGGSARITEMSNDCISFEITSETPCQLAMLTAANDTVLMVIETVKVPQADSQISFYDKNWKALKRTVFTEPKLADWLTAKGKTEREDVEFWLPFMLSEASYANGILTLQNSLDAYYKSPEDVKKLADWIEPKLQYRYAGKKFTRIK